MNHAIQHQTDIGRPLSGAQFLEFVREDYGRFLAEYGLTEAWVKAVVEDMSDHAEMPPGYDRFFLGPSAIQGQGLFAREAISAGQQVAIARLGSRRTVAGRLTNHSPLPNCRFEPMPDGLLMVSRHAIDPGEELTVDYRQVGSVNGWNLHPKADEAPTTIRWRASSLRWLGDPWARWFDASCVDLARETGELLAKFGHLPSIDVHLAEKQSKEIK